MPLRIGGSHTLRTTSRARCTFRKASEPEHPFLPHTSFRVRPIRFRAFRYVMTTQGGPAQESFTFTVDRAVGPRQQLTIPCTLDALPGTLDPAPSRSCRAQALPDARPADPWPRPTHDPALRTEL